MSGPTGKVTPLRPRRACPECGRPTERATYPFCSSRCKDIDLNRWLSGAYVIPARDDEEDEDGVSGNQDSES
ncbi:DNA gyrase inhibitor YacG [Corticibacterium sp. UT-5YL-CI-8]|nr:DNA gyrase inhibitor YacG [Tianweitania sp. UT-5YL-CI-8]